MQRLVMLLLFQFPPFLRVWSGCYATVTDSLNAKVICVHRYSVARQRFKSQSDLCAVLNQIEQRSAWWWWWGGGQSIIITITL